VITSGGETSSGASTTTTTATATATDDQPTSENKLSGSGCSLNQNASSLTVSWKVVILWITLMGLFSNLVPANLVPEFKKQSR